MSVTRESLPSNLVPDEQSSRPLLTVVVPVYNGGDEVVRNVRTIMGVIADGLWGDEFELVVVSDGSIDGTAERLLVEYGDTLLRVIHYDRNLGKGYAVKAGALAAHGHWIAFVDADLDLDPASIPEFLEVARREQLDFVIGSKRHPESVVHYPRPRRFASWCYQQLNRALFQLDVRDTQVGLKVLRREVVDRVVPLLLVKQFAFDLELLVVARALGYERVRELPIRLEYRFTGSGVRSRAVARALLDTAAVFYRLRVLRTYQRKQRLLVSGLPPPDELPLVTLLGDPAAARSLDYPRLVVGSPEEDTRDAWSAGESLVAVLAPGARPAGNWVSAAVPYLARGRAACVVVPTIAPMDGPLSERTAAAILESRIGGGSRRFRHFPGNVRVVSDYPAENCVIHEGDFTAARAAGIGTEEIVAWLAARGRVTVYTPDASIAAPPPRLVRQHFRATADHARARGAAARRTRGGSVSSATALSLVPTTCAALGFALVVLGPERARQAGLGLAMVYGAAVAASAGMAGLHFRSLRVGVLTAPALVLTQATYLGGFVRGLARGR